VFEAELYFGKVPSTYGGKFQWFLLGSPMDGALMGASSHNPALWR
jgi:hypothetical protein